MRVLREQYCCYRVIIKTNDMLGNFFKIAFRNIIRHRSYVFINVLGLSIGIACSIIIVLFILQELSYDKFNDKYKRIYRVYLSGKIGAQEIEGAWTAPPTAAAFVNEIPEIVDAVRMDEWGEAVVKFEDKSFLEKHFMLADSSFFNIFSIPLLQGDPSTALAKTHTVVLTKETAQKYFGNEDPVGKMIKLNTDTNLFTITGIIDNVPVNAHFEFDLLASFQTHYSANDEFWLSNNIYTYILLEEGASPEDVESKMQTVLIKYVGPQLEQVLGITLDEFAAVGNRYGLYLQPLEDIHLNPHIQSGLKPSNDKKYIYIFALIAFFIILLAAINYMNLSTARSANRSREVGLRKVVGSTKRLLIQQFLLESVVLTLISLMIAVIIVEYTLPLFNRYAQLQLSINYFGKWYIIPVLILLAVTIGVLSGLYPSVFMATFRPVQILSGKLKQGMRSGMVRSILVVLQFFISILIIVCTIIIYRQIQYMLKKDLGFDKEHLLVIRRPDALGIDKIKVFRQEIEKYPGVINSTNSTSVPGYPNSNNGFLIEGRSSENTVLMTVNWTDYDYFDTYKLELDTGRYISEEFATDTAAAVINESAVRVFELDNPLETRLMQPVNTPDKWLYLQVVGVVKDFNFQTLHDSISPHVFLYKPPTWGWGGYITVRISPKNIDQTKKNIEQTWDKFTANDPFQYFFLDEEFNNIYREERRTGKLSLGFAILSIFIACLGLFGLTSFAAEQKTKEIGVRKVLGSSIFKIIMLFIREIVILIIISTALALPLAFFIMRGWLQNFYYRISLSPFEFVASFLIAVIIALITVSYTVFMAASRNPVKSLQYE
jgi:putative ABC transport system permease protein